jgi:hypothetical protein
MMLMFVLVLVLVLVMVLVLPGNEGAPGLLLAPATEPGPGLEPERKEGLR